MFILPKVIYRLYAIPIKIPIAFFTKIEKTIQKLIWNNKGSPNSLNNLEGKKEKNKAGSITLPAFKIYYKPTIIKTVWCQTQK